MAAILAEAPSPRAGDPSVVAAGLAYFGRCLRSHRPFGVITGSERHLPELVERLQADCAGRAGTHLIHLPRPTHSVAEFLSACLNQVGFELGPGAEASASDEMQNLFIVFLRHEAARGRRTVVLLERTEAWGPHVFELMQTLSRVRAGPTPAITFMLTGTGSLHRVVDSPAMTRLQAHLRERFDIDRALSWIRLPEEPETTRAVGSGRELVVIHNGKVRQRRPLTGERLIIGRSAQCGLRLDGRFVSRHHAALISAPRQVTIVDLRSTNSTLVNGQPVTRRVLAHGDQLTIGEFQLRYEALSLLGKPASL
jgi:hypothetical protein